MSMLGDLFDLARAYISNEGPYAVNRDSDSNYKESSVRLDDGETHFHKWERSQTGATVTTRLSEEYGGFTDHTQIREHSSFNTGEDLRGFREVFGDDNKD